MRQMSNNSTVSDEIPPYIIRFLGISFFRVVTIRSFCADDMFENVKIYE